MWPVSCNLIGWIWFSHVNKENHRISLITVVFWSRDLHPAIWLVEIASPNVNKENHRMSLISYYIPVTWPESCNLIDSINVNKQNHRISLISYYIPVTWPESCNLIGYINVNKENHRISLISYYITVTWHVSHNLIGWNCFCQCKQRKVQIILFNRLFSVTWPTS